MFVNHDRVAARPREIARTQATLGPTSEKLTSDLALVPVPGLPSVAQARPSSDMSAQYSDQIFR